MPLYFSDPPVRRSTIKDVITNTTDYKVDRLQIYPLTIRASDWIDREYRLELNSLTEYDVVYVDSDIINSAKIVSNEVNADIESVDSDGGGIIIFTTVTPMTTDLEIRLIRFPYSSNSIAATTDETARFERVVEHIEGEY